jgi:hypothetical protein
MYLKSLAIFEKPSHQLKKASISLKMSSHSSIHIQEASNSLKISLKCNALFKKSLAAIAALPQWPVRPCT